LKVGTPRGLIPPPEARGSSTRFSLVMAALVMALAIFALPRTLRPVLMATAALGVLVALVRIARTPPRR
jgi:hypothetical protein